MRRALSLLAFAVTVVGLVAFAATPQKGRLGGGKSKPFVNDGGWQEFGMIGLLGSDGGALGAIDLDGGLGGIFGTAIGEGPGTARAGTLTKQEIRDVVRTHTQEITGCYDQVIERTAKGTPTPRGKVTLAFVINSEGQVSRAQVIPNSLDDPLFAACLSERAKQWLFPKPRGNGSVTVNYPLVLQPSE